MTSTTPTYHVKSDVRFRVLQGEAVVLRQDDAEVLVLNEVGSRILELLAGGRTQQAVIDQLLDEFEVDPAQLRTDVSSFIETLKKSSVLDVVAVDIEEAPE